MAFTQAMLDSLEAAIAQGARSVSYEGKSVTYSSLDDMMRIRAIIRAALGIGGTGETVFVAHDRGYGQGSLSEDLGDVPQPF